MSDRVIPNDLYPIRANHDPDVCECDLEGSDSDCKTQPPYESTSAYCHRLIDRVMAAEAALSEAKQERDRWKDEHYAQAILHTQYRREAKAEFQRNADDIEGLQQKIAQLQATMSRYEQAFQQILISSPDNAPILARAALAALNEAKPAEEKTTFDFRDQYGGAV